MRTFKFYLTLTVFLCALASCQEESFETEGKMRYLSVSSDFLSNPFLLSNDSNIINLREALIRIQNSDIKQKDTSEKELNMELSLYHFANNIIENTKEAETRSSTVSNSNCVPQTIAYLYTFVQGKNFIDARTSDEFFQMYNVISRYTNMRYGKGGLPWDELGCIYEELLKDCFYHCKKERFFREDYSFGKEISHGERSYCVGVIRTSSANSLHSVIILSIKGNDVVYFDPETAKFKEYSKDGILCLYYVNGMKSIENITLLLKNKLIETKDDPLFF